MNKIKWPSDAMYYANELFYTVRNHRLMCIGCKKVHHAGFETTKTISELKRCDDYKERV